MKDEEHHIDFLETQLDLINRIGLELYTQKHVGGLEGEIIKSLHVAHSVAVTGHRSHWRAASPMPYSLSAGSIRQSD